jgi:hypothetical protein
MYAEPPSAGSVEILSERNGLGWYRQELSTSTQYNVVVQWN